MHPIALDLKGSGIDTTDSNHVTTLAEYSKPLIDFLQNIPEDEKVWRSAQIFHFSFHWALILSFVVEI